ncbi:hypothetical protein O181_000942 [Austropuccinia psidii MF-1]|uniref:Reverse transcriptase domain-containing protein n=1 Tax=Austropuccinia psidii MF-1 TaxID=1389203 RepID=A0A9Q3B9M2_9BASI|nr:hypothetical protein [Austropuccinia psidii MF-1]
MEGEAPSRRGGPGSRLGEDEDEEGEESEETEVVAALAGAPEASEVENLAHYNQHLVSQAEPNFLKMMEQMNQFMGKLTQEVSPRENSKTPAFKVPSMKAPDSSDGTQSHKLRGFIQSFQLIFHNDPANFFLKLHLSLVELANGLNPTFQIFPMNIPPTCSIIGSYLKPSYSICLVIPMKSGKLNKSDFPSFPSSEWDFFNIDSPKGEDLILGYDFLYHFNPIIEWKNGLITYDSSHKASSGINSSTINDLATAVKSVALVGELMRPSLPSSVHIPSIIPSQSLLLARDEVLKEIKDVKAEKLPPHRACDHHIKLEGLLPPVCVIYSLSNQESETLWVYISENVEKGFIRPSSSSTGAPVVFVKKRDGGLCLCFDYRKLNSVTRKNMYPVSPMNQIVTVFNGSTIFSKINLCGAYNLLRIKEGDEL